MFLTKSIRRKMVFGLGLVVVMLGALLTSGLWGLASLRAIIQDESLDAATASEVVASVVRIRAVIPDAGQRQSPTDPLPVFDPDELYERIVDARAIVVSYRNRLNAPELRLQKAAGWNPLGLIERRLAEVQGVVELRKALSIPQLLFELDLLAVAAADLPELPGLHARLDAARDDYRTALTVVWVSSAFVFFGLLALVANVICLKMIEQHRHGEVHMRASWIFSKND